MTLQVKHAHHSAILQPIELILFVIDQARWDVFFCSEIFAASHFVHYSQGIFSFIPPPPRHQNAHIYLICLKICKNVFYLLYSTTLCLSNTVYGIIFTYSWPKLWPFKNGKCTKFVFYLNTIFWLLKSYI